MDRPLSPEELFFRQISPADFFFRGMMLYFPETF